MCVSNSLAFAFTHTYVIGSAAEHVVIVLLLLVHIALEAAKVISSLLAAKGIVGHPQGRQLGLVTKRTGPIVRLSIHVLCAPSLLGFSFPSFLSLMIMHKEPPKTLSDTSQVASWAWWRSAQGQ